MALIFPNNPTNGQTYTAATGVTYTYSSTTRAWSATGQPVDVPAGASAAQAAAGTATDVFLSPAYGTPKDGAGMAGAALLPAGTTAQRPGVPITGMTRFNTTNTALEVYDGSAWGSAGGFSDLVDANCFPTAPTAVPTIGGFARFGYGPASPSSAACLWGAVIANVPEVGGGGFLQFNFQGQTTFPQGCIYVSTSQCCNGPGYAYQGRFYNLAGSGDCFQYGFYAYSGSGVSGLVAGQLQGPTGFF